MEQKVVAKQKQNNPEQVFAQIGIAYVEVLSGIRRPEQLARWLSDKTYHDLIHKVRSEVLSRQVTGENQRPEISIRKSRIFLTDSGAYQAVVVMQLGRFTKALSIRAELIHNKYRVTDIFLV